MTLLGTHSNNYWYFPQFTKFILARITRPKLERSECCSTNLVFHATTTYNRNDIQIKYKLKENSDRFSYVRCSSWNKVAVPCNKPLPVFVYYLSPCSTANKKNALAWDWARVQHKNGIHGIALIIAWKGRLVFNPTWPDLSLELIFFMREKAIV